MADPKWSSKEPLSNAEFRKLLETPLPRTQSKSEGQKHRHKKQQDGDKPRKRPPKPGQTDDEEKKKKEEKAYRDRARERREGKNPDYEPLLPEMQAILQGKGLGNDLTKITVEDSKFLGGDLEHTHLVKGLDYALLQKERAKLEKEEHKMAEKAKTKQTKMEDMKFESEKGRIIYSAIFDAPKAHAKDFFAPRRTSFVFNTNGNANSASTPTILRRPKAECPEVQESMMAGVDANVLQMIAKIMSYMKPAAGKPPKKLKKRDKLKMLQGIFPQKQGPKATISKPQSALQPTTVNQPTDDEDIFADAATEYVFERKNPKEKSNREKSKKRSYFGDSKVEDAAGYSRMGGRIREDDMDLDADVPPPPPPLNEPGAVYTTDEGQNAGQTDGKEHWELTQEEKDMGLASVFKRDDKRALSRKSRDSRERDPAFLPDHYAECYPGYQTFAGIAADSDDEDFSKMDTRGKGMSRSSFETEEDWQRYKASMEAMPKAAYQYGVKMSDGRKTHKDLESRRKEQKLDTQLNKIEKILKDQGHDHTGAFKGGQKEEGGDAAPPSRNRKRLKV